MPIDRAALHSPTSQRATRPQNKTTSPYTRVSQAADQPGKIVTRRSSNQNLVKSKSLGTTSTSRNVSGLVTPPPLPRTPEHRHVHELTEKTTRVAISHSPTTPDTPPATPPSQHNKENRRRVATRRSMGSLNAKDTSPYKKEVWKSPGKGAEIPDILENAFIIRYPTAAITSKRDKTQKQPPWLPSSHYAQIPELPPWPVSRVVSLQSFEKRLRKALPKLTISTMDPNAQYVGFAEIGTGVNGSVVRASLQSNPSVLIAIKRCRIDADKEYRAAIVRELRIMSSGSPHVIRLREITLWNNQVWMVMDLMRCSVFAILLKQGIPENYTIYLARGCLLALMWMHSQGFIHRDVKCENLLIGLDGELKLADFGLATRADTLNCERLGTTRWMAPEVVAEEAYDHRVDLWSLGITIIEMMDRVPPHYLVKEDKEVFKRIVHEGAPTFLYAFPTTYTRGLVAWLLHKDADERPDARDVLEELDAHIERSLIQCAKAQQMLHFLNVTLGR
ncbi:hypothetical protein BZG36_04494 [Bifiguratus adelaidae]|uniref:mitogen-activated protein kinase kinase n=1 Tax=Bifiguratus adelaidae TaxID=1938954 RepID=A0A261XYD5_9FUNG|nr:hypothetical protein BZG36_04494 [Bifiguratus adelaidae]